MLFRSYYIQYLKEGSNLDLSKWQHDIYRFNGLPYDPKEIKTIKRFCSLADERYEREMKERNQDLVHSMP